MVSSRALASPAVPKPDVVDAAEVARRLGVKPKTVTIWTQRENVGFPEPDWIIGGRPAWRWSVVERWARKTGRLPEEESEGEEPSG